jgi:hypothetical protein
MYSVKGVYETKKGIVEPKWESNPIDCNYNVIITFVDPAPEVLPAYIKENKEAVYEHLDEKYGRRPGISPRKSKNMDWLDHPIQVKQGTKPLTRDEMYDRL